MYIGLLSFLFIAIVFPASSQETNPEAFEVYGNACEKIIAGESKSSARVRAADKAIFLGVKKLDVFANAKKVLNEHDMNVMVYRLVDEYVEDLSVSTLKDEGGKICVEVHGWLNNKDITTTLQEFIKDDKPIYEAAPEDIAQAAQEVKEELVIKPDNPENLALVHVRDLEYFNGASSAKYAQEVKSQFADNPYFYLTEDSEIADYTVAPKVLKARVDALDAGHKRMQMVVSLEVSGIGKDIESEYQNRFVLFGAEEDEQKIAARLIKKLLEKAGDGILRKIEHNEQRKLEQKEIGRPLTNERL